METALLDILKEIPAVAALIYLVVKFLTSIDKRDSRLETMQKSWTDTIERTTRLSTDAIEKNVVALTTAALSMEKNTAALVKFTDYFEEFKRVHNSNHAKKEEGK